MDAHVFCGFLGNYGSILAGKWQFCENKTSTAHETCSRQAQDHIQALYMVKILYKCLNARWICRLD